MNRKHVWILKYFIIPILFSVPIGLLAFRGIHIWFYFMIIEILLMAFFIKYFFDRYSSSLFKEISFNKKPELSIEHSIFHFIITGFSILSLFFYIIHPTENSLFAFISLIILVTVPGTFFIDISGFCKKRLSLLERMLLSYFIGIIFYGISWLILSMWDISQKEVILLIGTVLLSVINTFRNKKVKDNYRVHFNLGVLLGMGLVIFFYIVCWIILYPEHLYIETDISRHYKWAQVIAKCPQNLNKFYYILENSFQSYFISISNGTIKGNMLAYLSLILFLPISVLAASMRVFPKKPYLQILTVFFFTILNAVWGSLINFINYYLVTGKLHEISYLAIIRVLNMNTENSFSFSLIGLWNIPNFTNITAIFLILAIIFNQNRNQNYNSELLSHNYQHIHNQTQQKNLSKYNQIFLITFMGTLMFLTHIAEAVIFSGIIAVYGIFNYKAERSWILQISFMISSVFSALFFIFLFLSSRFPLFSFSSHLFPILLAICLSFFALSLSFLCNVILNMIDHHISLTIKSEIQNKIIISISLSVIIYLLIAWGFRLYKFFNIDYYEQMNANYSYNFGQVNWYDIALLGTKLFLALSAILIIANTSLKNLKKDSNNKSTNENKNFPEYFRFFVLMIFLAYIFGKIITWINFNLYKTTYFESRFVQFIVIPSAFLAPITIQYLKSKTDLISNQKIRSISKTLIIFFLINSTFLFIPIVVDTRYRFTQSVYALKDDEWEGIEQMDNIISQNPTNTGVFCLTLRGADYLLYTGSPEIIIHNQISNRNKTLDEFQYYCQNVFKSDIIYVFILKFSDNPYYISLKQDLRMFLEQNCTVYFENSGTLIIGPISF
ncbi:MAG: hypothetical protein K9W44_15050 [Candidatus Lokiarchaeota archaeon]|nr:hypothetical protein [Candidatus Harpocratesius repetitus]